MKIGASGYSPSELQALEERDGIGGVPPPFADKWVIYADIEGFSQIMLDTDRRVRLAHTYWDLAGSLLWGSRQHRVLNAAMTAAGEDRQKVQLTILEKLKMWNSRLRVFSDSIFVFLDPSHLSGHTPVDFTLDGNLVPDVASWLSRRLWEDGLAHKGAVAYGSCIVDPERNVFLGDAIVRAVRWTEKQEWFGLSIEPSSVGHAERDFQRAPYLIPECAVPVCESDDAPPVVRRVTAINCFPSDERKDGARVGEDRSLDGFLAAHAQSPLAKENVQRRYRSTARIWRDHFGVSSSLRRSAEVEVVAGG